MFVNSLESIKLQEIQRNAIFWAVLYVIPVVNIIGIPVSPHLTLMKVFYEHEINENRCIEDLRVLLNQYNLSYTYERTYSLPRRNQTPLHNINDNYLWTICFLLELYINERSKYTFQ